MLNEQEWSNKKDYYAMALKALEVPFSAEIQAITKFNHDFNVVYQYALVDDAIMKAELENIHLKKKMHYAEAFLTVSNQDDESTIDENGKVKKQPKPTVATLEALANVYINNDIVEEYGMPITKAYEITNKRSAFLNAVVIALKDKRDCIGVLQSVLKAERNS